MAVPERKKSNTNANIANRRLFTRTIVLMVIFCGLAIIPLIAKLWNLQVTRHDELQEKAVAQQTSTLAISATRGTIYDSNNNVLAISSTAYDICISPKAIVQKQEELDEKLATAKEKKQNTIAYERDVESEVATGLASILGIDESEIHTACAKTESQYKRLAVKVDGETEDAVRALIEEKDLKGCIYLQANTKRYYPYNTLASQIIGFTNDNGGAFGLEASFETELAGTIGRSVTAQNASGTDLLNFFQDYYDKEDGSDVHLTIDTNIQSICEERLAKAIDKYEVQDGGFILVMDCKTGAMLGMASAPTYDLNNYGTVTDATLLKEISKNTEKRLKEQDEALAAAAAKTSDSDDGENSDSNQSGSTEIEVKTRDEIYQEEYSKAVQEQWSNKCINETYEPGSTFKTIVLAAALEEGVTSTNDYFQCNGVVHVADYDIRCSNRSGHGDQDLATAVGNSCNPTFIALGQRVGYIKFYEYLEAFGIVDATGKPASTGIDLPGEGASVVWSYEDFNIVELATASFGQRFQVTPVQLLAAANAVVNGGYYYRPYVVDYVKNPSGTITYSADNAPLRQVISESTSETCREILEGVVGNGLTGKYAYREGYRIGGKTGTSETLVKGEYIVSFLGFAPADDPEIVVLVGLKNPKNDDGSGYTPGGEQISGGKMAAPVAGDVIVDVLDYLDYGKQYTVEELSGVTVNVPSVTGYTLGEARKILEASGLTVRVFGDGDDSTVVDYQTAHSGTRVPKNSEIRLYIGGESPSRFVTMPNLEGMTPSECTEELKKVGLYMEPQGDAEVFNNTMEAVDQSERAGDGVEQGNVVQVYFKTIEESTDDGDVLD